MLPPYLTAQCKSKPLSNQCPFPAAANPHTEMGTLDPRSRQRESLADVPPGDRMASLSAGTHCAYAPSVTLPPPSSRLAWHGIKLPALCIPGSFHLLVSRAVNPLFHTNTLCPTGILRPLVDTVGNSAPNPSSLSRFSNHPEFHSQDLENPHYANSGAPNHLAVLSTFPSITTETTIFFFFHPPHFLTLRHDQREARNHLHMRRPEGSQG